MDTFIMILIQAKTIILKWNSKGFILKALLLPKHVFLLAKGILSMISIA